MKNKFHVGTLLPEGMMPILLNENPQDVRQLTAKSDIKQEKTLTVGMTEKAKGFVATGSKIYHGNLPDGVKEI